MKKIPMRMCVMTREKLPKNDLFRIVLSNNQVIVDETGKVNGHGCYLKKDIEVIKKAKSKSILNHILNCNVNDEIYDEMIKILEK